MSILRWLPRSPIAVALILTVGALLLTGGRMFSPGGLNVENHSGQAIGGVSSHAELADNCSACHAPFWSRSTMTSRWLDCHAEVHRQINAGDPLHGNLPSKMGCLDCHSEHRGPHAALTSLARFDHQFAAFPLSGKHATLDCSACHKTRPYRGVAKTCVGCHQEPKSHLGLFGVRMVDRFRSRLADSPKARCDSRVPSGHEALGGIAGETRGHPRRTLPSVAAGELAHRISTPAGGMASLSRPARRRPVHRRRNAHRRRVALRNAVKIIGFFEATGQRSMRETAKGTPGRTRTCDRRFRKPLLYPAELRGRGGGWRTEGIVAGREGRGRGETRAL